MIELKREINIFNYKNYNIDKDLFIKLFINVIKKNNYNNLDIFNENEILKFYNFSFDAISFDKNKDLQIDKIEKQDKKEHIQKINKELIKNKIELYPQINFFQAVKNAEKYNFQIKDDKLDDIIIILNEMMSFINKKYGTTFTYSEFTNDTFLYHSSCIYKSTDENPKVVTAYINSFFQCTINCFHDSCKSNFAYRMIQHSINKNLYALTISYMDNIFSNTDEDLTKILNTTEIKKIE